MNESSDKVYPTGNISGGESILQTVLEVDLFQRAIFFFSLKPWGLELNFVFVHYMDVECKITSQ